MRTISNTEKQATILLLENAKEMRRCSERLMAACQSKLHLIEQHGSYDIGVYQADKRVEDNAQEWRKTNQYFDEFYEVYSELFSEEFDD